MTHRDGRERWWRVAGLVLVALVALFSLPLGALDAGSASRTFPPLRPAAHPPTRQLSSRSAATEDDRAVARPFGIRGGRPHLSPSRLLAVVVALVLAVAPALLARLAIPDGSPPASLFAPSPVQRGPPLVG